MFKYEKFFRNINLLHTSFSCLRQHGIPVYDEQVQCLPLGSLLLALNITKVDYISLDVEGEKNKVL